jgi:hypothetical protein
LKKQLEGLGLKRMRRAIVFMQSSRMENLFSASSVQMAFYSLVMMLICYWRRRNFCPQISI